MMSLFPQQENPRGGGMITDTSVELGDSISIPNSR